jgi:hypothetical protein
LSQHGDAEVILSSSNSYSHDTVRLTLRDYILSTVDVDLSTHHLANETFYMFGHNDGRSPWKALNAQYNIPPCGPICEGKGTKTVGIGGRHSGTSWHIHGPAFSEVLVGRKRWLIYPSNISPDMQLAANTTMGAWVRDILPGLKERSRIYDCVIEPGDLLYFPHGLYHATLNLDPYNAFMSFFV